MSDKWERRFTGAVGWLIALRRKEFADHWAWNLTPMPIGFPTKKQLFEGILIAILGGRYLGWLTEKAEREMNEALRQVRP